MAYLVPAIAVLIGVLYLRAARSRQNIYLLIGALGMILTGILLAFDRGNAANSIAMRIALIGAVCLILVGALGSLLGKKPTSTRP
ncbi:MAG: hypothetical protein M3Y21_11050 [Candidatus Eremiobacteraeota bacterium]|nr:hypothetical protein [Candidatus Eremiobacteraeota bacterium]